MTVVRQSGLGELPKVFGLRNAFEKFLGNASEKPAIEQFGPVLDNPEATAYVNAVGQRVVKVTNRPNFGYKFGIIDTNLPNAFALPNGSIYVTTGMLRLMRNEAQLAGLLGHEIGHVVEDHGTTQLGIGLGLSLLADKVLSGRVSEEDAKPYVAGVLGLTTSGYSRQSEFQADRIGFRASVDAGYDPSGLVDVMSTFKALEGDKQPGIEIFLRSHPFAADRLREVSERAQTRPNGELGAQRYQTFLTRSLGLSQAEVNASPTFTASSFLGGTLLPGIILAGGMAILLVVVLLKK